MRFTRPGGVGPDFPLHGLQEMFLGLGGAHTGQLLQAGVLFRHQVLVALALDLQLLFLPGRQLVLLDQFGSRSSRSAPFFSRFSSFWRIRRSNWLSSWRRSWVSLFKVHLHLQKLVFGLELGLFPEAVGFLAGFIQDLLAQGSNDCWWLSITYLR